jgi:hypothetical protein
MPPFENAAGRILLVEYASGIVDCHRTAAIYPSHSQGRSKGGPKVFFNTCPVRCPIVGFNINIIVTTAPDDLAVGLDALALSGGHEQVCAGPFIVRVNPVRSLIEG